MEPWGNPLGYQDFELEKVLLAEIVPDLVEIVTIGSDYARFTWNNCDWMRHHVFQLK